MKQVAFKTAHLYPHGVKAYKSTETTPTTGDTMPIDGQSLAEERGDLVALEVAEENEQGYWGSIFYLRGSERVGRASGTGRGSLASFVFREDVLEGPWLKPSLTWEQKQENEKARVAKVRLVPTIVGGELIGAPMRKKFFAQEQALELGADGVQLVQVKTSSLRMPIQTAWQPARHARA